MFNDGFVCIPTRHTRILRGVGIQAIFIIPN